MNIWLEITKTLVEMLKTGGQYAIWGISLWLVFNLLRVIIIGGIIWACIKLLVQHFSNFLTLRFLTRKDSIQMLSDKCSEHVIKMIEDYQTKTTTVMTEFFKQAEELLKKSEVKTNQTV